MTQYWAGGPKAVGGTEKRLMRSYKQDIYILFRLLSAFIPPSGTSRSSCDLTLHHRLHCRSHATVSRTVSIPGRLRYPSSCAEYFDCMPQ